MSVSVGSTEERNMYTLSESLMNLAAGVKAFCRDHLPDRDALSQLNFAA